MPQGFIEEDYESMDRRTKKLISVLDAMYVEAYQKSTPSGDWLEISKQAMESEDEEFFMRYSIEDSVLQEIFNKHTSKLRLNKAEDVALKMAYFLGATPRSV